MPLICLRIPKLTQNPRDGFIRSRKFSYLEDSLIKEIGLDAYHL